MVELVQQAGRFLARMDRTTWQSLGLSAVLLLFVLTLYFFGQQWLHIDRLEMGEQSGVEAGGINALMAQIGAAPLALVGVIAVFCLLALTGFPQILLIAACVLTFGPFFGAVYAWIATMISAGLTFTLGQVMGGHWVDKISGARAQPIFDFLSRRAIAATAIIRVVPSAPFIVINSAAGAARLPLWKFWLGTGIGIIPKIVFVAGLKAISPEGDDLNGGVDKMVDFFMSRSPLDLTLMALIIPAWLLFLWLARRYYLRMQENPESSGD